MLLVESLVFRKLTDADYFHINKPPGTEDGGGGQSYIDISTSGVTIDNWNDFFKHIPKSDEKNGPRWEVPILSLGVDSDFQIVTIAQRRTTSVSIREQKLLSKKNNRVYAWVPNETGFPKPKESSVKEHIEDLYIYIVKLNNGEFWAGWFQKSSPDPNWAVNEEIKKIFLEDEGYIRFNGDVCFDTDTPQWPFKLLSIPDTKEDETVSEGLPSIVKGKNKEVKKQSIEVRKQIRKVDEESLFNEDEKTAIEVSPEYEEKIRKTRKRNKTAVDKLKKLYNTCQISGEKYTFKKRDGEFYLEGHHLIPLGEGGSDSVYNIVVLSPLIHRMLHYAEVSGLDLTKIKDNKLTIKINDDDYTITWNSEHAKNVIPSKKIN
jgi:5-methylcytosine-specific restriction protein A